MDDPTDINPESLAEPNDRTKSLDDPANKFDPYFGWPKRYRYRKLGFLQIDPERLVDQRHRSR
jgi:hypothetical protein